MRKVICVGIIALSVAAGGFLYGKSLNDTSSRAPQVIEPGYTCPLTGEELPCPNCCPLNEN